MNLNKFIARRDNKIFYCSNEIGVKPILSKLNELISINYDEIDANTYILARNIWNLNSNLIITTNYDSVLEKVCDSKNVQPLYLDNNFKISRFLSAF